MKLLALATSLLIHGVAITHPWILACIPVGVVCGGICVFLARTTEEDPNDRRETERLFRAYFEAKSTDHLN